MNFIGHRFKIGPRLGAEARGRGAVAHAEMALAGGRDRHRAAPLGGRPNLQRSRELSAKST